MKIYSLFILLIFASCNYFKTKQQQAESLAGKHLDSVLNGPANYEIVKHGLIDTLRGGPDNEPAYKLITAKIDSINKADDLLNERIRKAKAYSEVATLQKVQQKNSNTRNTLLQQSLQYLLLYKGKPEGWIIEESYRLKGPDTNVYIATFKIDNTISKILSQQTSKKL